MSSGTRYCWQRLLQGEEPCERDRERTNLWFVRSFAKRRLAKFNGCSSDRFVVHLMECQWRYNHRNDNLVRELANILKRHESRTSVYAMHNDTLLAMDIISERQEISDQIDFDMETPAVQKKFIPPFDSIWRIINTNLFRKKSFIF